MVYRAGTAQPLSKVCTLISLTSALLVKINRRLTILLRYYNLLNLKLLETVVVYSDVGVSIMLMYEC